MVLMPSEPNTELRNELKAAIAAVRHQINVQSTADHYVGSGTITQEAIAELQSELVRLQEALAGLP